MNGEHSNTREAPTTEPETVPQQGSLHTHGPWYVRDLHPTRATFNIGTNPSDPYDGEVAVIFRNGSRIGAEANARLISAAPDLLKLAREYASACINCSGSAEITRNTSSDGDPLHDFAEPCPECEHIRDAIAKATGEHS